jgi:hypothetical protein
VTRWRIDRVACALVIALIVVGCAGGREFRKPDTEALVLGKTTMKEIRDRLGTPQNQGTLVRNGETLVSMAYSYALAVPYVDEVKVRAMGFFFFADVLVGYNFTSSFDEDKTRFDDTQVPTIERGRMTRSDLIALFGTPGGFYRYPLIKDKTATAFVYFFIDSNRHPMGATVRQKTKLLVVSLDAQGVVSDVEYTTTAPK